MTSDSTTLLSGIIMNGEAVTHLYPGWEVTSRHDIAAGFSVVLFTESASGREACWWLHENTYRGSHVFALSAEDQNALLSAVEPTFKPLSNGVLSHAPEANSPLFRDDLPIIALRELAAAWLGHYALDTLHIPSGHAETGEALTCPNGDLIPEGRITSLLQARPNTDAMVLTSPFSGAPLRAQITLDLISHTGYRFHDKEGDQVFYLIWATNAPEDRPSFYYPKGRLLISDSPMGALMPDWVVAWFAHNPQHITAIENARPFLAEDFGVGRASSTRFQARTTQPTTPPAPYEAMSPEVETPVNDARSDFLPTAQQDTAPTPTQTEHGFLHRLKKRLFHSKTL